jgi:uncharacterized membrane protein YgdD (TMEM256/DUF423 family)
MDRLFFGLGALSGLIAVAAGAFGAHALKAQLAPDLLAVFDTAARYQMFHALALMACAWAAARWPGRAAATAGWCFVAGTGLFSGSLYLLALTGARSFGAVTPFGGVLFLVGWLLLAVAAWRGKSRDSTRRADFSRGGDRSPPWRRENRSRVPDAHRPPGPHAPKARCLPRSG